MTHVAAVLESTSRSVDAMAAKVGQRGPSQPDHGELQWSVRTWIDAHAARRVRLPRTDDRQGEPDARASSPDGGRMGTAIYVCDLLGSTRVAGADVC